MKLALKLWLRGQIYFARHLALQAVGYRTTNPAGRNWESYPQAKMQQAVRHIFQVAGISTPVETLIDHGCAEGRYADNLRPYAKRLIGIDIFEPSRVTGYDQYIQAELEPGLDYLDAIPDASVDIALIIASTGLNARGKHRSGPHSSDWTEYFGNPEGRQGRYFTPGNYPRVIRPGGHIVVQEWEAWPERRVGKLDRSEVEARIDEFYPHAPLTGFSMVAKGISPYRVGPYITYRRDASGSAPGIDPSSDRNINEDIGVG